VHIIIGMVKDKATADVLKLFPAHYHYYFTQANLPRALQAHELQTKALAAGLSGNVYKDVNEALRVAMQAAAPTDTIVVCGSVFLVGEVEIEQLIINNG
jgi:dihydrofolate synthase / folylpolyglutamate synthase